MTVQEAVDRLAEPTRVPVRSFNGSERSLDATLRLAKPAGDAGGKSSGKPLSVGESAKGGSSLAKLGTSRKGCSGSSDNEEHEGAEREVHGEFQVGRGRPRGEEEGVSGRRNEWLGSSAEEATD